MRNRTFQRELEAAEGRNSAMILEVLRNANKIHLEPVTLVGDGQTISNNLFWDCKPFGLSIQPAEEKEAEGK